ncbi:flavodoxin domain-containing protein [Micromonospora sp. NBC_00898]|uniref:flavodoxin family protein n=1 Tax=Micromonospora sp. NBC_00898 TaxID=2975981 RepID=UPI003870169E|nr:flavodoxin domain-containing protein [Micromonospora sp. NBC_00898]
MRALVVYESMYGNTKEVAEAVAGGLAELGDTVVMEVGDAPDDLDPGLDLLVVGGPTHAHGMSRPQSRQSAADEVPAGVVPSRTGLREWLGALGRSRPGLSAAAFDTRFDKPRWLTGSAAVGAARLLGHHHCVLVVPPESFYVEHAAGPLAHGELDRARRWGEKLGTRQASASGHHPVP